MRIAPVLGALALFSLAACEAEREVEEPVVGEREAVVGEGVGLEEREGVGLGEAEVVEE